MVSGHLKIVVPSGSHSTIAYEEIKPQRNFRIFSLRHLSLFPGKTMLMGGFSAYSFATFVFIEMNLYR